MIRVIINADDLGKSHNVNEAIRGVLDQHVITSSTIMANTLRWEEVQEIVRTHPDASFGVHLNLTEGRAITRNPLLLENKIVDADFIFTKRVRDVQDWHAPLLQAIYDEWDAQIRLTIEHDIPVSHIDGHHHIHAFYPFRDILVQLLSKYHIPYVRNRYVFPLSGMKDLLYRIGCWCSKSNMLFDLAQSQHWKEKSKGFAFVSNAMETARWQQTIHKVVKMTDYFDAYDGMLQRVRSGIVIPDNSVVELMCHPGHPNYMQEYERIKKNEFELFCSQIQLITYNEYIAQDI